MQISPLRCDASRYSCDLNEIVQLVDIVQSSDPEYTCELVKEYEASIEPRASIPPAVPPDRPGVQTQVEEASTLWSRIHTWFASLVP